MRLDGLSIYVGELAVHLAYRYRKPYIFWSDLSASEQDFWIKEAYDLMEYLKKQKANG